MARLLTSNGAPQLLDAARSTPSPPAASVIARCGEVAEPWAPVTECCCTTSAPRELLLAIVDEVERRQMAMLAELPDDPADAVAAMWADVRQARAASVRAALLRVLRARRQGEQPFARMLPVRSTHGCGESSDTGGTHDPALARLGLAVTRGLLLDLVATGDEAGVDAAARAFAELLRAGSDQRGELARQSLHIGATSASGLSGSPNSTSVTPSSAQRASFSGSGLKSSATICGAPSRSGGGPGVLQQLHGRVDVEVARRGDPAVGGLGDPLEVLLGAGRADEHRDVRLDRLGPRPLGPNLTNSPS